MTVRDNEELGARGERIGCNLLQQALNCNVQPWHPDRGLDAPVQFISTAPENALLHFNVQIKTGFSFVEDRGHQWRVKNLDRCGFEQWRNSQLPVVLVWVHPDNNNEAYWHLVSQETSKDHFFISKARRITPVTRFDLTMKLARYKGNECREPFGLLIPPLSTGIRTLAKNTYRNLMKEASPVNPLLGAVIISWHGWRHITSQSSKTQHIFQSLQLLPIMRWVIENPGMLTGFRRVREAQLGRWILETRIIVFQSRVRLYGRSDTTVEYALRETIQYPVDWFGTPRAKPSRRAIFESIYERKK